MPPPPFDSDRTLLPKKNPSRQKIPAKKDVFILCCKIERKTTFFSEHRAAFFPLSTNFVFSGTQYTIEILIFNRYLAFYSFENFCISSFNRMASDTSLMFLRLFMLYFLISS